MQVPAVWLVGGRPAASLTRPAPAAAAAPMRAQEMDAGAAARQALGPDVALELLGPRLRGCYVALQRPDMPGIFRVHQASAGRGWGWVGV
jgi:hypothetical protein